MTEPLFKRGVMTTQEEFILQVQLGAIAHGIEYPNDVKIFRTKCMLALESAIQNQHRIPNGLSARNAAIDLLHSQNLTSQKISVDEPKANWIV